MRFDRGAALYALGRYPEAQKEFQRAAEAHDAELQAPTPITTWATPLFKQERYKDALDAYKHTLGLRPDDRRAKWNLELALRTDRSSKNSSRNNNSSSSRARKTKNSRTRISRTAAESTRSKTAAAGRQQQQKDQQQKPDSKSSSRSKSSRTSSSRRRPSQKRHRRIKRAKKPKRGAAKKEPAARHRQAGRRGGARCARARGADGAKGSGAPPRRRSPAGQGLVMTKRIPLCGDRARCSPPRPRRPTRVALRGARGVGEHHARPDRSS